MERLTLPDKINPAKLGALAAAGAGLLIIGGVGGWLLSTNPVDPSSAITTELPAVNSEKPTAASPFGGHVHALVVNPVTGDLYLGARPIYRSQDGGKTWTALEGIPKIESRANITSIALDPKNPDVMYATGHGRGIVKTTDGGATWTSQNEGLSSSVVEAITVDVNDSNQVYAWVPKDGLYRSNNAGDSWQRVSDGPNHQEIRSLASVGYPTEMGGIWLYAGLDTGVTKSPDCFCGWDNVKNNGLPVNKRVYSVAPDPSNYKTLYAGTQEGVFKTDDAGTSWRLVQAGITDAVVTVNAANPQQVYAVSSDGKLWHSPDAGATWAAIQS